MRATLCCWALLSVCLSGCGTQVPPASPPPFQLDIQVKDLMNWIMDPHADIVWAAVGTIVSEQGEEKIAPKTDEEWTAVRNSAAIVLESGNLLLIGGRARDQGDWVKKVEELMRRAKEVLQAAEAKDAETLFTAGSDMYLACSSCHAQYIFSEAGEGAGSQ